ADMILISDTAMISLDTPSIDVGVRGLIYLEMEITGTNRDLHSGVYGGAVANPVTILAQMISSLHDKNNRITIPHFYDAVAKVPAAEKASLAKAPFNERKYKKELGIKALWGEKGFTTNERTGIRPTLEVNGIWGGYTDEGAKTVLPSKAYAKISCRLVPNQKSDVIEKLVVSHLYKIAPSSVTVNIKTLQRGDAYLTPLNSIEYKTAAKAIEETLGKTPVPVRGGGSIPIAALFEKELGCRIIFLGFGLDSDNLHSPNEKLDMDNFYKGIETILHFHTLYSTLKNDKEQ
ncbi:MAG TPA: M20/M25/M40 family metallo-hydrolase, partial [Chitinophagaceae bacterium]|nr:M20/M25/M40 family metallo-hydrolase [Chitinophagaceae bacterium]